MVRFGPSIQQKQVDNFEVNDAGGGNCKCVYRHLLTNHLHTNTNVLQLILSCISSIQGHITLYIMWLVKLYCDVIIRSRL